MKDGAVFRNKIRQISKERVALRLFLPGTHDYIRFHTRGPSHDTHTGLRACA